MHGMPLQGSTAALGLYINSGSIYESPENAGASHMLEYLAFRTTQHRCVQKASGCRLCFHADSSKVCPMARQYPIPDSLQTERIGSLSLVVHRTASSAIRH